MQNFKLIAEPILFFLYVLNDKVAPKLQLHKSLLACIDWFFWWALLSFGNIDGGDACLLQHIMEPDSAEDIRAPLMDNTSYPRVDAC